MTTFAHLRAVGARLGAVLAVGVLVSAAAAPARAQVEGPEADDVREREIAFAQTMADRDFDAFQTFIHPDAVFFNGNTTSTTFVLSGTVADGDVFVFASTSLAAYADQTTSAGL